MGYRVGVGSGGTFTDLQAIADDVRAEIDALSNIVIQTRAREAA